MRHKDGAVLVVTRVPPRAAPFVFVGFKAVVLPLEPEEVDAAVDAGLYRVQIGAFTFWWSHQDLGMVQ